METDDENDQDQYDETYDDTSSDDFEYTAVVNAPRPLQNSTLATGRRKRRKSQVGVRFPVRNEIEIDDAQLGQGSKTLEPKSAVGKTLSKPKVHTLKSYKMYNKSKSQDWRSTMKSRFSTLTMKLGKRLKKPRLAKDTFNQKVDVLPMAPFYSQDTWAKDLERPTLPELHAVNVDKKSAAIRSSLMQKALDKHSEDNKLKFGWIEGVFNRCLLNIWGVILFLRMSWIVGEAGILATLGIILLSTVLTTMTTISMSAICTNGKVRGGGAYFLISRSLGPKFGGAIGLIFSFANAVAVAMYVVGFAENITDLLKESNKLMTTVAWDVRIIGVVTLFVLMGITQAGMAWESKAQIVFLVILIISLLNYFVGVFIPMTFDPTKMANMTIVNGTAQIPDKYLNMKKLNSEGHFQVDYRIAAENLYPQFSKDENFFSVFNIFFPATTGILAGSNISGDLKNPSVAIPKGTFAAIGVTSAVYCLFAILIGSHSVRLATGFHGQANPLICPNLTTCGDDFDGLLFNSRNACTTNQYSNVACDFGWNYTDTVINAWECPDPTLDCRFGLKADYMTMTKISGWGPLITCGIIAATLSSALASLVSAPKIFQSFANDELLPWIKWFGKPYGSNDEPRRAYLLAFIIALAFILIGELNAIAPLISNFFLITYGLINYACFNVSFSNSPGWRPTYKLYNKWVSLLAALLCIAVMVISNWWATLITIFVCGFVYKWIDYRMTNNLIDVNWGSSSQSFVYQMALKYVNQLVLIKDHVKNYRPQILCLSGDPSSRPYMVELAATITDNVTSCFFGDIRPAFPDGLINERRDGMQARLNAKGFHGLYCPLEAPSLRVGLRNMMQLLGAGKLEPNTIMMGMLRNWRKGQRTYAQMSEYCDLIHMTWKEQYGLAILAKNGGLDVIGSGAATLPNRKERSKKLCACSVTEERVHIIDVYWFFDDGGLTLLLPYLFSMNYKGKTLLRVFTLGTDVHEKEDMAHFKKLMMMFRIDVAELKILTDWNHDPLPEYKREFNAIVQPFVKSDESLLTDELLELYEESTKRVLCKNQLMQENSKKSDMIFATLPVVREDTPPELFLTWMDMLSRNLPPTLLVRGNQKSVLTFYS